MLGQSFAPIGNGDRVQSQNGQSGPAGISPVQEAVRTLSLRIPRWTGGGTAPVPQALLQSPGMAGLQAPSQVQGNPIMQALLRMIQGGFGAPPMLGGMDGDGLPPMRTPPPPQGGVGDLGPTAPSMPMTPRAPAPRVEVEQPYRPRVPVELGPFQA